MPITRVEAIHIRDARIAEYEAEQKRQRTREIRVAELCLTMQKKLHELGFAPALIEEILEFQKAIDESILQRPYEIDIRCGDSIYAEVPRPDISPGAARFLERAYESAGWFMHFYGNKYDPRDTRKKFTLVRGFDLADREAYLAEQGRESR